MLLTATHCLSSTKPSADARPVRGVLERLAAVALDPGAPHVVAVGDRDVRVRVQVRPEGVERQRHLVDPALGVERRVRVGVVRPARRHLLGPGGDAVVALDLVGGHRRAVLERERPEVEVVERRERLKEELRRADKILGAGLDGDPGLGEVRVVETGTAGARVRRGLARRHRVTAAGHGAARHLVRHRHTGAPQRLGECRRGHDCGERKREHPDGNVPHNSSSSCRTHEHRAGGGAGQASRTAQRASSHACKIGVGASRAMTSRGGASSSSVTACSSTRAGRSGSGWTVRHMLLAPPRQNGAHRQAGGDPRQPLSPVALQRGAPGTLDEVLEAAARRAGGSLPLSFTARALLSERERPRSLSTRRRWCRR